MSRTIPEPLNTRIKTGIAQLTTIWYLKRTDGVIERWTAHDRDIVANGATWSTAQAYTSSTQMARSDLSVMNGEIMTGETATLGAAELDAGRYDDAEIVIYGIDWSMPDAGSFIIQRGWIGNTSIDNGVLKFEFRSLTQRMQQIVGRVIGPTCDAELGDARCKVNLVPFTVTGTATTGSTTGLTDPNRTEADNWFKYGKITFIGGQNDGLIRQIESSTATGSIVLYDKVPYPIAPGDGYSMTPGCDKSFSTCRNKYSNEPNFRGFPHVPGADGAYTTVTQ